MSSIICEQNIREVVSMKTVKISLNSIDKVKAFVNDVTKFNTDFDLVSGRYVIDAKSIMGIFSLNLLEPITCCLYSNDKTVQVKFLNQIKEYMEGE